MLAYPHDHLVQFEGQKVKGGRMLYTYELHGGNNTRRHALQWQRCRWPCVRECMCVQCARMTGVSVYLLLM